MTNLDRANNLDNITCGDLREFLDYHMHEYAQSGLSYKTSAQMAYDDMHNILMNFGFTGYVKVTNFMH